MVNSMIFPIKFFIVPNCKLAKVSTNQSEYNYQNLIADNFRYIVENKRPKKYVEILSEYQYWQFRQFRLSFFDY